MEEYLLHYLWSSRFLELFVAILYQITYVFAWQMTLDLPLFNYSPYVSEW